MPQPGIDFGPEILATPGGPPCATVPERPDRWPGLAQTAEFMSGGCGVFALALSDLTGWPLALFLCGAPHCVTGRNGEPGLGHVAVRRPGTSLLIDAFGHRTARQIRRGFAEPMKGPYPGSLLGLVLALRRGDRQGPYSRSTFTRARQLLLGHWGFYSFPWPVTASIADPGPAALWLSRAGSGSTSRRRAR